MMLPTAIRPTDESKRDGYPDVHITNANTDKRHNNDPSAIDFFTQLKYEIRRADVPHEENGANSCIVR